MGSSPSFSSPNPESMASILQAYQQYLPQVLNATATQAPNVAGQQLLATQLTQPGYDAINLQEARNNALPLAQVGQQVSRSNALAGARTNLAQIQGAGGQAAQAAEDLARKTNPNYYNVQDQASQKAQDLLGSVNLNGLSPGEYNSVERNLNQNLTQTGNLGLDNPTNIVSNAMNFGGAFNNKIPLAQGVVNTANQTATSAQNTGFNPVNIALGQPNASTMGNFGTGTFTNTTPSTQNNATNSAFGFGSSLLGNQTSQNNAAIGANTQASIAGNVPAYLTSACCFIFLEATNGQLPWWVRELRDGYYVKEPLVAKGYKRMAQWLVPVMRHSHVVTALVNRFMVQPIIMYGGWLKDVKGYEDCQSFWSYKNFWFNVWRNIGAL